MERVRKHNKITTFLSNFRTSNHQIIHTLRKPSRRNSKKYRQGKAIREEGSTTYITKTRRKDFQNIKKSRHFSVFSESQIIRSNIRLANHHEETQKKYAKEKPSERRVQLRISQKHVGKSSTT